MLDMLKDLIRHKGHANATLLKAIRQHDVAGQDPELRQLLHHIILANRFWLMLCLGLPFAVEEESRIPESLDMIAALYRETDTRERQWVPQIDGSEMHRQLSTPFIPGATFTVGQALMQVCMHSHGHRAQCASRLRLLGGTPPAMDFLLWLKERPDPDWS